MRVKDLKETVSLYGDFNSGVFIKFLRDKIERQLKASIVVLRSHADVIEAKELKSLNAFRTAIENALQSTRTLVDKAKKLDESSYRKQIDRLAGDLETFRGQIEDILKDLSKSYSAVDRPEYKELVKELYQILRKVDNATSAVVIEIDAILDPKKAKKPVGLLGKLKTVFSN